MTLNAPLILVTSVLSRGKFCLGSLNVCNLFMYGIDFAAPGCSEAPGRCDGLILCGALRGCFTWCPVPRWLFDGFLSEPRNVRGDACRGGGFGACLGGRSFSGGVGRCCRCWLPLVLMDLCHASVAAATADLTSAEGTPIVPAETGGCSRLAGLARALLCMSTMKK